MVGVSRERYLHAEGVPRGGYTRPAPVYSSQHHTCILRYRRERGKVPHRHKTPVRAVVAWEYSWVRSRTSEEPALRVVPRPRSGAPVPGFEQPLVSRFSLVKEVDQPCEYQNTKKPELAFRALMT